MIFRQLLDPDTSTYTYLLGDARSRHALLIDPVLERADRDLTLIAQLDLTLTTVLDTHIHADHITASGVLRERTGAETLASRKGASCVDRRLAPGEIVRVGSVSLRVLPTPGHTDDSVSFLLLAPDDDTTPGDRVFTGDALLIRAAGRTDFQNGDAGALYDSITEQLFTLPDTTLVYPGHDYAGHTVSSIAEEKRWNARIASRTRAQFVEGMASLKLPEPARLHEAVPANRACGRPATPVQG